MFSRFKHSAKPAAEETEQESKVSAPEPQEERDVDNAAKGGMGGLQSNLRMSGMKPSVISEGFEVTGNITAPGALHIEGTIRGQLNLKSATVGPHGVVEGEIECDSLQIKGRFTGTAVCKDLFVASSAVVEGRIYYLEITAQRGASIQGELILKTR